MLPEKQPQVPGTYFSNFQLSISDCLWYPAALNHEHNNRSSFEKVITTNTDKTIKQIIDKPLPTQFTYPGWNQVDY